MFEIKRANRKGVFHLQLIEDPSLEEIYNFCKISENVLGNSTSATIKSMSDNQSSFAKEPVDEINMGSYVEPDEGYTFKFIHLPKQWAAACRILKDATGISIMGCKAIIKGNFPCPILTEEIKDCVLEQFKKLDVYVKVIPTENYDHIDIEN